MVNIAVGKYGISSFILTYESLPMAECEKTLCVARLCGELRYHAADHGLASEPSSLLQEAAHEPFWIFLSHRYAAIESKAAIGHIWELLQVVIDYRMYEILVFKARFAFLYDIEPPFIYRQLDSVPKSHEGYNRGRDRLGDCPTRRNDLLRYQEIPV